MIKAIHPLVLVSEHICMHNNDNPRYGWASCHLCISLGNCLPPPPLFSSTEEGFGSYCIDTNDISMYAVDIYVILTGSDWLTNDERRWASEFFQPCILYID